jgi:hypothetical protein
VVYSLIPPKFLKEGFYGTKRFYGRGKGAC